MGGLPTGPPNLPTLVAPRRSCEAPPNQLDGPLEAILARVVDVPRQDPLAGAREAHAFVEAVRQREARIRPEDHPVDAAMTTPRERPLGQRAAGAAPAECDVEVEPVQLG